METDPHNVHKSRTTCNLKVFKSFKAILIYYFIAFKIITKKYKKQEEQVRKIHAF